MLFRSVSVKPFRAPREEMKYSRTDRPSRKFALMEMCIRDRLKGHARTQKVYDTLVQAAQQLLDVAKRSKGQSNKELAKFTSQIKNLLERWQ